MQCTLIKHERGEQYETFTGEHITSDELALAAPDSGEYSGDYANSKNPIAIIQTLALALSTLEPGGELQLYIPANSTGTAYTIAITY